MKRDALLRLIRKEAKAKNLEMLIDKNSGKGSHYMVTVGNRKTTIKSGELTRQYEKLIRKQLGLD